MEVMSDALLAKTDSEALPFQKKAFEIAKTLKDESSFMEDQRLYPTICHKLAHIHHAMGNLQEALSLAAEAVQILEGLTEKAAVLDNRKELAQALSVASAVYASSGKHDEAVAAIHRAISMMEKMIEDAPEMVEYPRLLAQYHESLAGLEELPHSLED
jgi:tetratricopeptide (TPR) repeat protein